MSIDDRLQSGLTPQSEPKWVDDRIVDRLVDRARRRHRVRVGIGVGAAAAATVIALAALPQVEWNQSDNEPAVNQPTTPTESADTWTFDPQATQIDNPDWGTRAIPRAERLAALEGTAMEQYGPPVFRALYPNWPNYRGTRCDCVPAAMELKWGTVSLNAGFSPGITGGFPVETQLDGTFTVKGDRITFDFERVGRSTFRWAIGDDGQMSLTFIHASPGTRIAGAPAEAALRMLLTAAPFGGK